MKGPWLFAFPSPPPALFISLVNFTPNESFGRERKRHKKSWKHCTKDCQNEETEPPFEVGFPISVSRVNTLSCVMIVWLCGCYMLEFGLAKF